MLLLVEEKLQPEDSKGIRSYTFEVPVGTGALGFQFGWTPKFSKDESGNRVAVRKAVEEWLALQGGSLGEEELPEDIRRYVPRLPNLFNVVLRDPEGGWRGRSDKGRGSVRPLTITENDPPEGFVEGPLLAGVWRADVEVHAVVPPGADFRLSIWKENPAEVVREKKSVSRVEIEAPDRPFPGWFRGELHSHSVHSDGGYPVRKLVRRAEELGLDFLALTDHNTVSGLKELDEADFPTIRGVELTTFHGHHIVLGVSGMVPWHQEGERLDINDVASAFREQGALFTLSHPYSIGDPVCTGCRWSSEPFDRKHVDLVEIWHRKWSGERSDNQSAYDLWNQLWQEGFQPTAIGVRDWHTREHEAPLPGDLPTTAVHSGSAEQADVLKALKKGACYVTTGPWLEFALRDASGKRIFLGENGEGAQGGLWGELDIVLPEKDGGWGDLVVQFYRSGVLVEEIPISGNGKIESRQSLGDAGWYRAEIRKGGDPVVITNHILMN